MFVGKHGFLNPFFFNLNQLPAAKKGFTNDAFRQHFYPYYIDRALIDYATCNSSHTNRALQFQLFLLFGSRDEMLFEQLKGQFFCVGLSSICFLSCLDSCLQTYVLKKI